MLQKKSLGYYISFVSLFTASYLPAQNFFTFNVFNKTSEALPQIIVYPEGNPALAINIINAQDGVLRKGEFVAAIIDVGANSNPPCLWHIFIPNPTDGGASGIEFSKINFCTLNELHLEEKNNTLIYTLK